MGVIDPNDKHEFADIMGGILALYGKDSTSALLKLYWRALVSHSIESVRWAFDHWVKDPKQGTFMPKPADIIRTIQEQTGTPDDLWLSANEAWAIALPAINEASTVVWSWEMARAFEVARPILAAGDKIGARMAFIPAYERQVDIAKRENRKPVYEVSAGWDEGLREIAVQQAVVSGLLPPPKPQADQKRIEAPIMPILFDEHVKAYIANKINLMPADHQKLFDTNIPIAERMAMLANVLRADRRDWRDQVASNAKAEQEYQARKVEAIQKLGEKI